MKPLLLAFASILLATIAYADNNSEAGSTWTYTPNAFGMDAVVQTGVLKPGYSANAGFTFNKSDKQINDFGDWRFVFRFISPFANQAVYRGAIVKKAGGDWEPLGVSIRDSKSCEQASNCDQQYAEAGVNENGERLHSMQVLVDPWIHNDTMVEKLKTYDTLRVLFDVWGKNEDGTLAKITMQVFFPLKGAGSGEAISQFEILWNAHQKTMREKKRQ